MSRVIRLTVCTILVALSLGTSAARAEFRAGASAIDITPVKWPVVVNGGFLAAKGEKAVDPLHARCVVLDDGKTSLAMVVVDTCVLPHELVDEARAKIHKATGIPGERVMISATHTHTAPSLMAVLGTPVDPEYPAFLVEKLVETVAAAKAKLVPAKYGFTVVHAPQHTNCRQWVFRPDRMLTDPFGQQTVRVNMHPGYQNASTIAPSGPTDPDLSLLSFQTTGGKPIALFANYSMHYFGAAPVSADYFGAFCAKVEDAVKTPGFVAAMSQGTSGDSHWMDYSQPKKNVSMQGYAEAMAKLALEAHGKIEHKPDATLAMAERDVHLRVREPDEARLAWAKGMIEKMGDRLPASQPEVYAIEAIKLHEHPTRDVKVSAIRIGDVGIATMSNEVFALTGLKVKAHSPLKHTFNIELANGEDGYIPPAELHPMGGYTTWPARSACLEVGAEAKISETAIALLEEVSGESRRKPAEPVGDYVKQTSDAKPLAYWRFSEMGGPAVRDVNGREASAETGVLFYLDGPKADAFSGKDAVNRCLHFAGGRLTTELKDLGPSYTVDFWFWNGLPGEARPIAGYLFSRGTPNDPDAAGDHLGIGGTFEKAAPDRLMFFNGNKANAVLVGASTIQPKTWNHVVLVRDGRKVTVYLNGNSVPDITGEAAVTVPAGSSHVFLGGRNDNRFNLEGKLDEVAIFNRALSAEEATARYKLTGFPVAKPPVELVPPRTPAQTMKSFKVAEGFEVQLVAAEPLVLDPVAIAWGPDGKLWVAEMADYPLGVDDKGTPGGRVRYLRDTDGDGAYDTSTVFLENVRFPTSVLPWRDGVLVTAAPEIYFAADRDGDGRAEVRESLYVGFTEGNTQLRVNSLKYGLDNWVYVANGWASKDPVRSVKTLEQIEVSGRDLRIRPDEGLLQAETGMTEFGRDRDDWGNWFGCNNSYPVWHFVLSDRYMRRNPHVAPPEPNFMMTGGNPRVFPISREQKRYHSFGHAGHYTSACATTVYRDEVMFPRDGKTWHHFICEPMHNVVQHLVSKENGATFTMAERAPGEEKMDFLASDDEWFRPVNLATGPDGALYVADMYRYMIEHPDWLPPQGQAEWKPYHRTGHDKGRIWRIVPKAYKPRAIPRLDKLSGAELAAALDSPNGWQRDMAQQLIVWRKGTAAVSKLEELTSHANPLVRLQALCTLDGLNAAKSEMLVKLMSDPHPSVRRHAVRIAEPLAKSNSALVEAAAKLVEDPDAKVRLQLACSLGEWQGDSAGRALATLALRDKDNPYIVAAVMSSAVPHYRLVMRDWLKSDQPPAGLMFRKFVQMAVATGDDDTQKKVLRVVASSTAEVPVGGMKILADWFDARAAKADSGAAAMKWLADHDIPANNLFDAAQRVALDDKAPPDDRAAGVGLLGRNLAEAELDATLLAELMKPQVPPEVQRSAVRALARVGGEQVPGILTANWAGLSPEIRAASVDLLLTREPWTFALLQQVEAGKVAAVDVDVTRRGRLEKFKSARVTELAAKLLGETSNTARAKVVESYAASLTLTGDAKRGHKLYMTNCAVCHKYGDAIGQEIGPDLRSVRDWPADSILANILDPNRKVEPRYLSYTATLASGDVAFGVITAETGNSLSIKGLDGKETTVLRADVKSLEGTNRSLMPDGLEAALNKQQMADLIRFLKEPEAAQ